MNLATKYVKDSRTTSPVYKYITDHGDGIANHELKHDTIAGREIAVSTSVTAEERAFISDGVNAISPSETACFANAFHLWEYDPRFNYVEGVAVKEDLTHELEHAWCMLNGEKLVDPTTPFDHYHGVTITDPETIQRHVSSKPAYGVIGNHKNRFEFLRERGYVE